MKISMLTQKDVNLDLIKSQKVAIIGCGSQWHAHALNLQESWVDVVVGLRPDSNTCQRAISAGLRVMNVAKASEYADIIVMLVPDTKQPQIYEKEISKNLKPGKSLVFAHGFNIHYGTIVPSKDVDVRMVAPKWPGHIVRE